MNDVLKMADIFESKMNETSSDTIEKVSKFNPLNRMFNSSSVAKESKLLYQMAGKITYRAHNEEDPQVADRLRKAGKLVLAASDLLK